MNEPILINLVVEIVVKTTVVVGVFALLAMTVCRGSSASARHGIWSICLSAAIAVPVFVLVMPDWGVWPPDSVSTVAVSNDVAPGVLGEVNKEANLPGSPEAMEAVGPATVSAADAGGILATAENGAMGIPVSIWITLLWSIGVLVLLGRIGLGFLSLARLGARSRGVCDRGILEVFEEVRDRMGMRGEVRILVGAERVMPMSWGIFSRTILLPEEAAEWGRGRLRSVLLHEMAHLERRDPLHLFWAKVACALHWFHPLVWFAAWRQEVESEVACDDRVLESGVRGSDYAMHLLEVVTGSGCRTESAGMAVAMARSASQLESRVAAAVDPGKNRRRNSRAAIAIGCALALVFVVPVSMLTAAPAEPVEPSEPAEPSDPVEAPETGEPPEPVEPAAGDGGGGEEATSAEVSWESLVANRERLFQLLMKGYKEGTAGMGEVLAAHSDLYDSKLGLARVKGDSEGELEALKGKVDVAKRHVAIAKRLYQEGAISEKEVLEVQGDVLKAQIEWEEAKSKPKAPKAAKELDKGVGSFIPVGGGDPSIKPEDVYLEGFLAMTNGEELIEQGKMEEGLAKLAKAEELIRYVRRTSPAWQRQVVDYRLKKIEKRVSEMPFSYMAGEPKVMYERDGGDIVEGSAADLAVARGYLGFKGKGKLRGGQRITIMTAKERYKAGEEIRVIHVLDATVPGIEVSNVGPKRIFEEYVDGKLVVPPKDELIELVRGSNKESPSLDFLYEVTSYSFDEPGEHTIQWKGGGLAREADLGLESNVLRIVVEK